MCKARLRTPWLWALGLGLALAASAALAQTFSETTEVVVVEVPVQVIKDGEPVRGLTAENFEIYDGRKKQTVTGVEVLDLSITPSAAQPEADASVPAAGRRHFLMLFDLSFSEPKSVVKARDAAKDLVQSLHPTDLVAVATYSNATGPQLVLGFTADRRQIATAIDTLGAPQLLDRSADPLRLVLKEAVENTDQIVTGGESRATERRAAVEAALIDTFTQYTIASERSNNQVQRAAVTALTRSLADWAKLMGSVEGRKYVLYLSEGFDSSLVQGTQDTERQTEISAASESGEIWNVDSEERFGSTKTANEIEKMLEEFRRADCVIQAVDIGGLRAGSDQGYQRKGGKDSLLQMAKGTGGELYENYNDLSAAMGQMLRRTAVTYVLTFQPNDVKWDGSYRKLRVELKNAPRGARLAHRPGYYTPKPYKQQSPLEKLLQTANEVMSGEEEGSIVTSVLAAPFQVPGDKAYVPVLIEVDGKSLLANTQGTGLPTEVYVYALDETGAVHDFLTQTLPLDLSKAGAMLKQSGLKFFGHLDLLPGSYSLRVLVRNGVTGASGLRVVPVEVPQFAQAEPVLLPPFFPEPPNRWLLAREAPRSGEEQKQVPYPFMLKDQPYIPASRPVLSSGQAAQVALVGYNLGTGELKAQSRVLTPDGREVAPAEIQLVESEPGSSPHRLIATFRPPQLQPGQYVLQVTVTNAAGKAETSTTPFVVGSATSG